MSSRDARGIWWWMLAGAIGITLVFCFHAHFGFLLLLHGMPLNAVRLPASSLPAVAVGELSGLPGFAYLDDGDVLTAAPAKHVMDGLALVPLRLRPLPTHRTEMFRDAFGLDSVRRI